MQVAPLGIKKVLHSDVALQRNPVFTGIELDEEMVCLDNRGNCFALNSTGRFIWGLLEEPKSIKQILNALLTEFPKERNAIEQEIPAFLERMLDLSIFLPI